MKINTKKIFWKITKIVLAIKDFCCHIFDVAAENGYYRQSE